MLAVKGAQIFSFFFTKVGLPKVFKWFPKVGFQTFSKAGFQKLSNGWFSNVFKSRSPKVPKGFQTFPNVFKSRFSRASKGFQMFSSEVLQMFSKVAHRRFSNVSKC